MYYVHVETWSYESAMSVVSMFHVIITFLYYFLWKINILLSFQSYFLFVHYMYMYMHITIFNVVDILVYIR